MAFMIMSFSTITTVLFFIYFYNFYTPFFTIHINRLIHTCSEIAVFSVDM